MKRLFLFFSFIVFSFVSAQTTKTYYETPKELQGFWQIPSVEKGGWDGFYLNSNYIEDFYSLLKIDSIQRSGNKYTFYTNSRVIVDILSDSSNKGQLIKNGKTEPIQKFKHDPNISLLKVRDYDKAIKGKWIIGDKFRDYLSINKKTLNWKGEQWNIEWLGEYLGKEFRALIEKDGEYRLIYISYQKNNKILRLVYNLYNSESYNNISEFYNRTSKLEYPNFILGTWCDPKTNEWILGVFDKIIVYENKAWKYEIVSHKKNQYQIELKDGEKKQLLSLQLKGKELQECVMQTNGKTQLLTYTAKPKPYNYPDEKPFTEFPYKRDTVTISGYLENIPDRDIPFEIRINNPFTNKDEEYTANIDENGLFSIKFPVLNTSEILLDSGRSALKDIVEPGESYFIYINYKGTFLSRKSNGYIWQMGSNARLHREISDYDLSQRYLPYPSPSVNKKNDFKELSTKAKKVHDSYINNLKAYKAKYPKLSNRFKTYIEQQIDAFFLDRIRLIYFVTRTPLPTEDFKNGIPDPITRLNLSGSLVSYYYQNYIDKNNKPIPINFPNYLEGLYKKGEITLDSKQLTALNNLQKWENTFKKFKEEKRDTAYINTEAKKYKADVMIIQDVITKEKLDKKIIPYVRENMQKQDIEIIENMQLEQILNDCVLSQMAFIQYSLYEPLPESVFNEIKQKIKNPLVLETVVNEQNKLVTLSKQKIDENSFKEAPEFNNTNEIFQKLIAPYKGKVIYVDFWGTWCAPCRMEMEHAEKIKKALKDKDIIFMYIVNRSPEKSWKNLIKKYNLTGENIVHYRLPDKEQYDLEKSLGVNSFPTYMIIGKNGKIVNKQPFNPSDGEKLISQLLKYIEE